MKGGFRLFPCIEGTENGNSVEKMERRRMHSRHTVVYICEEYTSGNCYYYKTELITHDSWRNPESLSWSRPRPISRATFLKQKKAGFRTEYRKINKKPAQVIPLHKDTTDQDHSE
ncbi:hypothetical protein A374_10268 [Fictibacillus macauensis ZFHKF-1]|uniref:Uncharacterized protein n=1 Tax=Fictibacillus macauensis ZFHKF-1 TaxID=1196324 RepID=I8UFM3_9BACL|nr:hypothetical protein A374_10268 [Fictibacillus macauensis ZFHKF-1]